MELFTKSLDDFTKEEVQTREEQKRFDIYTSIMKEVYALVPATTVEDLWTETHDLEKLKKTLNNGQSNVDKCVADIQHIIENSTDMQDYELLGVTEALRETLKLRRIYKEKWAIICSMKVVIEKKNNVVNKFNQELNERIAIGEGKTYTTRVFSDEVLREFSSLEKTTAKEETINYEDMLIENWQGIFKGDSFDSFTRDEILEEIGEGYGARELWKEVLPKVLVEKKLLLK